MVEDLVDVGFASNYPGKLTARGTASEPIRFTTARREPPLAGSWSGLHFTYAEGNALRYVQVEYAGAKSSNASFPGTGNVNVYREIGAFLQDSEIARSSNCGVSASDGTRPDTTKVTTLFTRAIYHNTFTDNVVQTQCLN